MDSVGTRSDAYKLLHDGIIALAQAEKNGIRIDVAYCEIQRAKLENDIIGLEQEFMMSRLGRQWGHVFKDKMNLNSNDQLRHLLYVINKLEPSKMTDKHEEDASKNKGSVNEETLVTLDIDELVHYIRRTKLMKAKEFIDRFLREHVRGWIHPNFDLHLVKTFRSSSSNPNFQNLPARDEEIMQIVRGAIYPRRGHLILELDFKGIEVSVSVCYHKDPNMERYVRDKSTDMHRDMTKQIFFMDHYGAEITGHTYLRKATKNGFVFPQFYGDWYKSNAISLACNWGKLSKGKWSVGQGIPFEKGHLSDHFIRRGIDNFDAFTNHVKVIEDDFWGRRFRVYAKWKEDIWQDYQEKGYLDMYTGFRYSGMANRKQVCNTPIQGSAFHCLLWSFIEMSNELLEYYSLKSRLIGQIHDSILADIWPDELEDVVALITAITTEELPKHWSWIKVPMEVDLEKCEVDRPWSEKKAFKIGE